MTNLESMLKSRDITLLTKIHLVKAMVFPVVMYGCENWTIKKAECQISCFLFSSSVKDAYLFSYFLFWSFYISMKNPDFPFTFHFHALEKEMATHSSVLAWRIPGTGEPGGLPSIRSHRVRHDWRDLAAAAAPILSKPQMFPPNTTRGSFGLKQTSGGCGQNPDSYLTELQTKLMVFGILKV